MIERRHWSFSALNQFLRCPLQYYFERVLRIPRTSTSSGLIFGSAVHNALALYHGYLQRGEDVQLQQVHQVLLETWLDREAEHSIEYKPGESRDELIQLSLELLKLYLDSPPPQEIVSVEQRFLVPLRNSRGEFLETPLLAFADLVTRESGVLKINEFKTSGRAYGEFEVETSLQATCYVNAILETTDEWAAVEYTVFVKTKTPKLQRLKTSRNENDVERLGDLVENVERAVSNKLFYPVETPLNCSTCSYRPQCRDWRPERVNHPPLVEIHELNGAAAC